MPSGNIVSQRQGLFGKLQTCTRNKGGRVGTMNYYGEKQNKPLGWNVIGNAEKSQF